MSLFPAILLLLQPAGETGNMEITVKSENLEENN